MGPPLPTVFPAPSAAQDSPRKGSLPLHTWVKPALPSFTRVGALPSSLPTCWAALPTSPRLRAKVCGGGHWPGFLPVQESPPSVLPFPNHSEFLYRRSHACSQPCPGPSQAAAGQSVPHRQSARAVQPPRLTLRSLSLSDIPARARPRRGGGAAPSTRPPVHAGSQVDCASQLRGLPYKAAIQGSKCVHELNYSTGLGAAFEGCMHSRSVFKKIRQKNLAAEGGELGVDQLC